MRAVFISSTFRDMQFERDAVQTRVLPRLNDFLSRYAETAHFGDLRWGVNTTDLESDESSKKVLRVCLDQIDDCKPYMIVFIGERYGWIPSRELLQEAALLKGIDADKIEANTSVTELEIEYGALLHPDLEGRILFYFRNPFDDSKMTEAEKADYLAESPLHAERVRKLKQAVMEKYPQFVRTYDVVFDEKERKLKGMEALTDRIYEDLQRIFDLDLTYLNSLPKQQRALQNSHAHFTALKKDSFLRKQAKLPPFRPLPSPAYQARFEDAPLFEVITGATGAGAKTVVAQRYAQAIERGENAVCFSYGADEFTNTTNDMFSAFIFRLEELLRREHSHSSSEEYFADLCAEYAKRTDMPTLRFFVIRFPQGSLTRFHRVATRQPDLYNIGFCVHFQGAFDPHLPLPFFLKNKITVIPPLEKKERRGLIDCLLRARRKELSAPVVNEILKREACKSPLYLSLLIQRLVMLDSEDFQAIRNMGDGMDNINKYMIGIVQTAGRDTKEITKNLLKTLTARLNPVMLPHLIAHLTLPYHFTEEGLKEFFDDRGWNFSSLDYTLFKKTFPSLVYESSNGFLFFTNDEVKTGAQELLAEEGYGNDLDEAIDYLNGKSEIYKRKALPLMLHAKGDGEAFLNFFLPKLDIPASVAFQKSTNEAYELFQIYAQNFTNAMRNSYKNGDGFAQAVIRAFAEKIADGKVLNPYTVASFLFSFIEIGKGSYEKNARAFDFVIELIEIFDEFDESHEPIAVLAHILRFLYTPLFNGKTGERRHAEFLQRSQAYNQTRGPILGQKLMQLQQNKRILLDEISNRLSVSFYQLYRAVSEAENPTEHPHYPRLVATCKTLEAQALHYFPDYYERLEKGDLSAVRALKNVEAQAFSLIPNSYIYALKGDLPSAERNYRAFLRLHELVFGKEGIDEYYLHDYLCLLDDYTHFTAHQPNAKETFLRLYGWAEDMLCDNFTNTDAAGALATLFFTGVQEEYFPAPFARFCAVFTLLKDNISHASVLSDFYQTFTIFNIFSFAFFQTEENGELERYCFQLLLQYAQMTMGKHELPLPRLVENLVDLTATYCESCNLQTQDTLPSLFAFLSESIPIFGQEEVLSYALAVDNAR